MRTRVVLFWNLVVCPLVKKTTFCEFLQSLQLLYSTSANWDSPSPLFPCFFFLCFVYFPWNWFVPEPPKQSGQVFVSAPQWARHTCLLFINPGCFTPAKAPPWLLSRLICSTMSLQGNTGTKWLPVSVRHFLAGMKIDWLDLITKTCGVKLQEKSRFLVVFFSGRLFPLLKFYQLWCTHSSELLTVIRIIYLDGIRISIA